MAKTRGTGLLMVWADIDPQYEEGYNRWYEEEHLAHLLSIPGFLSAGRYVAVKGGPKFLALYELEAPDVLRSAAFLDGVRHNPSPLRVQYSGGRIGRNYILNGYRQIFPSRTNPIEQTREPAPFLQMGRIDIPAVFEEEFNDWYNTAYIPPYLAVPGCLAARRFVALDGQPKYLTLYEFENPHVSESEPWERARDGNPWSRRIRPFMRHDQGSPGVYRRISPR
ncbi:MAG: hypothetical protein JO267_05625 [Alphaproteobacteria bacterium]|nr:hypothetical protein [Alphaproteobacteria bacterium]